MNNSLRKLLSFALAVIMCISLLPSYALAEEMDADQQTEEIEAPSETLIEESGALLESADEESQIVPELSLGGAVDEGDASIGNEDNSSKTENSIEFQEITELSNKSVTFKVALTVNSETAAQDCGIAYFYGLNQNIDPYDESTYIQMWNECEITETLNQESRTLDMPELIPDVEYYFTVAIVTYNDGNMESFNVKARDDFSFETETGNQGFESMSLDTEYKLNGYYNYAYIFTAPESAVYKFNMYGGGCASNAYNKTGLIIDCTADWYESGHARYVSAEAGQSIYFYATGFEEGENRYTLTVEKDEASYDEQELRNNIDALGDGGSIDIYNSIALTSNLTIPSGVWLSLNGGTLTVPQGKTLTINSNAGINVNDGSLAVAGSIINNGCLGQYSSGNITVKTYSGTGEVYEQIDSSGTISGLAESRIIAKKYVKSIDEIDEFCSDCSSYLRTVADAGDIEINKDYELPENCTLNIVPTWDDGYEHTGMMTVAKGVKLTVGSDSEFAASANTRVEIKGSVVSYGRIRTDRGDGEGRIVICDGGTLKSNGSTDNYGVIEVSSAGSEIIINEDNYEGYNDYRNIEVRSIGAELNGLSEDKCVLILSPENMTELKSCLETEGWSCVSLMLGFNEIDDDITVNRGFTLTVPTAWDDEGEHPSTVTIDTETNVNIAPDAQICIEEKSILINNGTISLFGGISDSGNETELKNNGTIKLYSDGWINDGISVTGSGELVNDARLQTGNNSVYSNCSAYCFTAPEEPGDGWYLFKISGEQLSGFGYSYDPDDSSWNWLWNTDTASIELASGQSVYINLNSRSGNAELLTIYISNLSETEEYLVSTGDYTALGNDFADVELTFSAEGGEEYEYGVFYAPYLEGVTGGKEYWLNNYNQRSGITCSAPALEQTVAIKSLQTIPGTQYMYQAFIAVGTIEDGQEDTRTYYFGDMKEFTTKEICAKGCDTFTDLSDVEEITPDGYAYYFDFPENSEDMYVFRLEGYDCSIQVYNDGGYSQNELCFENMGDIHVVGVRKPPEYNGCRLYIYVNTNGNDNCTLTIGTEEDTALHAGKNSSLSNYELYSYVAPEKGTYRFSTWDSCRIWGYYQYQGGWQNCGTGFETYAEKGDEMFAILEWGSDITVKRYDDDGRRVVSTAAELIDSFNNGDGEACIVEGKITLPLPAGQSSYCYYTNQQIVIPSGSSITVPNGVTLTSEGSFEICDGGELKVGKGGRFENNNYAQTSGNITVEITGELQNNSFINMIGGVISCDGDCYNNGWISVDCGEYSGDPKTALSGNIDFTNTGFYKSVTNAAEAEAFYNLGESYDLSVSAYFENDVTLENSLFVPYGNAVEVGESATLTIPAGKTLTIDGSLYFSYDAKIENNGTLKVYNEISCKDNEHANIINNRTLVITSNCSDVAESIIEGDFSKIGVSGIAVASAEDLIKCMEKGAVSIVEDITLPAGEHVQDSGIEITNGATFTFAKGAKLESNSAISVNDGTLDIAASGAELSKIHACVLIQADNAYFNAGDNFKPAEGNLGVIYFLDEDRISEHTDLNKSDLTAYRWVEDFDGLKEATEQLLGWKYVLIDCKDVELNKDNCPDDDKLIIPENVVLEVYEDSENGNLHLTVCTGAYVENNGIIAIDGSGEDALLTIEKDSHFTNNGQIIAGTSGTIEGLEYIENGITIDDCVLYKTDGNESWWYYSGTNGENCLYAKTVFKANKKLTWSMDKEYSQYATFDAKKATLTPKKLSAETLVVLTATYGTCTIHLDVTIKPTATKIAVYGNGENVSGKKVSININDNCIPVYLSVLPEDAYCSVTATCKNKDFYIVSEENYIVFFKDEKEYQEHKGKDDLHDYIIAVIEMNGNSGTLYLNRPELCNGKSIIFTAISGKVKTSTTVNFIKAGEDIEFDDVLSQESVDITGGEKLTLQAHFGTDSSSDSIAWELASDESTAFASLKTVKGVTTLTTNKVTANTSIWVRAYSANNHWGCYEEKEIILHPAATSAQIYNVLENEDGEQYYEPIADKSKIFVTTDTSDYKLTGSLMPSGDSTALYSTVVFASKNTKVVSVTQDGENATLSFGNAGVSAVTLTYKNAAGKVIKSSTVTFTVRDPFEIELNSDKGEITAGASAKQGGQAIITATFNKKPANNKLVWSLKEDYLSDWITLKASGTKCTVTAKAGCDWKQVDDNDGSDYRVHIIAQSAETGEISAEIPIAVKPKNSSILLYTYLWNDYGQYEENLTGTTCNMNTGDKIYIEKICLVDQNGGSTWVEKGSNMWNNIVWKSSSPKAATVDRYGCVTAEASGTAKITAGYTFANGVSLSGEFTVKVGTQIESIEIKPANDTPLVSGKSATFAAYDCNTGKKVNAVFSLVYGSEYASVTSAGAVKAVSGLANRNQIGIRAVLKDNPDVEAYYNVELWPAATNLIIWTKLNGSDGVKSDGKTFNVDVKNGKVQLQVTQYPYDSYYNPKFVLPKGVSIDSQGNITFAKAGTYTIKVVAGDGSGKSSQVKFNVQRSVETIEANNVNVACGKSETLKVVLNGGVKADAPKNTKVTWSLLYPSDEAYCKLTAAGKFTANANTAGMQVKVVVTAQDNGLKDIITVTII